MYQARCAECHGPEAEGVMGPNLTRLWIDGATDDRVFQTVRSGIPGSVMPSSSMPDNELWALVSFLKSLGAVPPWDEHAGDAEAGGEIFAANCAGCHQAGGKGGRLGPDLARISSRNSRDAVIQSIRDPALSVEPGFRSVLLVTADGHRIRGAIKSEDAFSIQIMDTNQRLQGYLKRDLQEVRREDSSLMPAFGPDRLSEAELDHLLRYLATL